MRKQANEENLKCVAHSAYGVLSDRETQVVRRQIRNNSLVIDHLIEIIDLLVNKERCPKDANTLADIRQRLAIAVAENDTFRRVLWRHLQLMEHQSSFDGTQDAALFLMGQIKTRAALSSLKLG